MILPVSDSPDISLLDWSHYAGIYADYIIEEPALDSVCSDHFRSMVTALRRLHALGYGRPGLMLQHHHDERVLHRWEVSFRAYQEHHTIFEPLAPEIVPEITRDTFIRWFKSTRPDVVLCHRAEAIAWMAECGASVPETHGFCCLNVTNNAISCAGLDLQPAVIGARGIELLIGQLFRNEYGVPSKPSTTTIPGAWVDGPTLRNITIGALATNGELRAVAR